MDCGRLEMTRHEYEEKLSSELQTRQTFLVVIETLICLVITGVSVLGNGLVFVAVYRNPRLRKPFNLYIISLAVSDLILSAVAKPFTCVSAMVGNWMFGATLCWFQASLATMLGTTSLMNMALIAANRFLKVVYPNMHRKLVSVKTILISIAFALTFQCVLIYVFNLKYASVSPMHTNRQLEMTRRMFLLTKGKCASI